MLSFQNVGAAFGGPQIAIEFVGADIIRPLITIEFEDGNFYRFIVERRGRRSLQYSILQIRTRSFAAVYVTYVVGCRGRQPLQILFRPQMDTTITH